MIKKLFNTLTGFVAMNQHYDELKEPDEAILKARRANYGLIRKALVADEFIRRQGLEDEYKEFEAEVDAALLDFINNVKPE